MKYALVIILLVFTGCQIFESTDTENIDPDLIGDWYTINNISSAGPSPLDIRVRGWSITAEGELRTLGVVDSTGALGTFDPGYQTNIVQASNGNMIVKYIGHPNVAEDEVEYQIATDHLIIEHGFGFINGTFQRSQVGNQVVPPVPSTLHVKVDGINAKNVNIAYQIPTAYVSKTPASGLKLTAALEGKMIMIHIDQYEGPGAYTIGKSQAEYYILGSDWVQPYHTIADSAGTIFIDCDADTFRCSGEFKFSTNDPESDDDTEPILENGSFDVPLLE